MQETATIEVLASRKSTLNNFVRACHTQSWSANAKEDRYLRVEKVSGGSMQLDAMLLSDVGGPMMATEPTGERRWASASATGDMTPDVPTNEETMASASSTELADDAAQEATPAVE